MILQVDLQYSNTAPPSALFYSVFLKNQLMFMKITHDSMLNKGLG